MILALKLNSFVICVFGILFLGIGSSFGDSVNLGFLKAFPPVFVGSYCGGVGTSAFLASLLFLILKIKNVDFLFIFIFMLVIYPLYFVTFLYLIKLKKEINKSIKKFDTIKIFEENIEKNQNNVLNETKENQNDENIKPVNSLMTTEAFEEKEANINLILSKETITRIFKKIWKLYVLNISVHFCEFLTISAIISQICYKWKNYYSPDDEPYFIKYSFEYLMLVYQTMVMIFRSSLLCFQMKNTWSFSIPIFVFFIMAFIQSLLKNFLAVWLTTFTIIGIGIFAGISYANLNYLVLNSSKLEKSEKVRNNI